MRSNEDNQKKDHDEKRYSLDVIGKYGVSPRSPLINRVRHDHSGMNIVIENGRVHTIDLAMKIRYEANLVQVFRSVNGNPRIDNKSQLIEALYRFIIFDYDDARITINDYRLVMSNAGIFAGLMYELNDKKITSFTDQYIKRRIDELKDVGIPKSLSKDQLDLSKSASKNQVLLVKSSSKDETALPRSSSKDQPALALSASGKIITLEERHENFRKQAEEECLNYKKSLCSGRHSR